MTSQGHNKICINKIASILLVISTFFAFNIILLEIVNSKKCTVLFNYSITVSPSQQTLRQVLVGGMARQGPNSSIIQFAMKIHVLLTYQNLEEVTVKPV